MRKKLTIIGTYVVLLVIIGLLGIKAFGHQNANGQATDTNAGTSKYPLLARRIFLTNPNDTIINFVSLRKELNQYFKDNDLEGSYYFEYLPTGTNIRIGDDEKEIAASLIKLPAAMDLYKAAEMGKINLDQEITLQEQWLDSKFGNLYEKGAGYKLTLREAAKIMLEQSDNTALKAIAASTSGLLKTDENVLSAVDVDFRQNQDLTVSIAARPYSSFLKCLYFSCFTNYDHSQEILDYLSHTDFEDRLQAGITDRGVTVAHKIGVSDTSQSDCGIVYLPKRNYNLCIILHGTDEQASVKHIAELSKRTYTFVKNAK